MLTAPLPRAVHELRQAVGRELPLDSFHNLLRRAAESVQAVQHYGCSLISCSDELNGDLRASFELNVGRSLTARHSPRNQGNFPLSNISGQYEPGAFGMVHDHFRAAARGAPAGSAGVEDLMVLFEIASHVGRRLDGHQVVHGEIDRKGRPSPCCGALAALLDPRPLQELVAHPWFDKLTGSFGPDRLDELRELEPADGMLRAAVVHAAIQAEAVVAEVLREAPRENTWVLVAPLVLIDQAGILTALPVGYHLLNSDGERVRIEGGYSLRTTPGAISIEYQGGGLQVTADEAFVDDLDGDPESLGALEVQERHFEAALAAELGDRHAHAHELVGEHREAVRRELAETREQMNPLRSNPEAWRVYARPLLRSLFQGLTLVAPEVGLAALLVDTGRDWASAKQRYEAFKHGPNTPAGRRALREIEASIQQLGHDEAQAVLEQLVADTSPLVAPAAGQE